MRVGAAQRRSLERVEAGASSPSAARARSIIAMLVVAVGCAADPAVSQKKDGGDTTATCIAPSPLPPPRGAETLFLTDAPGGLGQGHVRLLGSRGGGALAYLAWDSSLAFTRDPVPVRRHVAGGWSAPETFPEPIQHMGKVATSMTPAGDTTFVWPSLDAEDINSVNLHARTLTLAGSWSDLATLGDTSVVWWQDPTVPVVGVASNEVLSIAAWTRIDPAPVALSGGLWSAERRGSGGWEPAQAATPAGAEALLLQASPDGTARAVWASPPSGGSVTLTTARWDGSGWSAPERLAEATGGSHFELSPPPGSSVAVSPSGEIIVVYALMTPTEMTLRSVRSADGVSWTTETIADLPAGSSWDSVTNAAGQVLSTWGSPPDQTLHASLYSPGAGWSPIDAPAGVRNDESAIALADDGRVAIADSPPVPVPTDCTPRTAVRVHRLAAGSGWAEPEVVDDAAAISSLTALAYAGSELLVLWQRVAERTTYAVSLREP